MKTKIDTKKANKVLKYRQNGLTYREIAKIMDEDVKSVYRWHRYFKDGKISTGSLRNQLTGVGR